jgi:hypothetical protein
MHTYRSNSVNFYRDEQTIGVFDRFHGTQFPCCNLWLRPKGEARVIDVEY